MGYGCDVIAITENGGYHTKRSERSNLDQELLQHEREKEDREECRRQKQKARAVCVYSYPCVCVFACACARGYITSWQRTGSLMCFSFALRTSRPRREEPRQTLCDVHQHSFKYALTPIHTHTQGHIYTHTRKLQHLVAKIMSVIPLTLPSHWHIDWWWRAYRTFKWLLAGLQREQQESSNLLSKKYVSSNWDNLQWLCLPCWELRPVPIERTMVLKVSHASLNTAQSLWWYENSIISIYKHSSFFKYTIWFEYRWCFNIRRPNVNYFPV